MTDVRTLRREPPTFRRATVRATAFVSPRLIRVTLAGPELEGFAVEQPAASVRLLLPSHGELVIPAWRGNEFLLPDGSRPTIRTLTPRRADAAAGELDVDIVVHRGGAASTWATGALPGAEAAVSGPGRGYTVDPNAGGLVLAGDETAIPAISQLLESLPATMSTQAHIEVAAPEARIDLPGEAAVTWHDLSPGRPPGDALFDAVHGLTLAPEARVWVAGEAAAVQRIRRHLFEERGLPRSHATVRGYWKHGRAGDGASET
jgi:NADPH-dependent ferric siderophore reductase